MLDFRCSLVLVDVRLVLETGQTWYHDIYAQQATCLCIFIYSIVEKGDVIRWVPIGPYCVGLYGIVATVAARQMSCDSKPIKFS